MTKSPFPGMDPYLEPRWLDVRGALIGYARDALNARLPEDLAASMEERLSVESDEEDEKRFSPDVLIYEARSPVSTVEESSAEESDVAVETSAPIRLILRSEPVTERFIQIIETATERLITVIEVVSPSNKLSPGITEFKRKRRELLSAGVNFVEIDLVRAGDWRALLRPHKCPPKWRTIYRVAVRTPRDPHAVGLYPITLRDALPSIVIPLRLKDPEVRLDLQPLLDQAYVNGRYRRRLNYQLPLSLPLEPADADWARGLMAGESQAASG